MTLTTWSAEVTGGAGRRNALDGVDGASSARASAQNAGNAVGIAPTKARRDSNDRRARRISPPDPGSFKWLISQSRSLHRPPDARARKLGARRTVPLFSSMGTNLAVGGLIPEE